MTLSQQVLTELHQAQFKLGELLRLRFSIMNVLLQENAGLKEEGIIARPLSIDLDEKCFPPPCLPP